MKGIILDELCATTVWHRNHARKALSTALQPTLVSPRSPRPPKYGPDVIAALTVCWTVLGMPAGKRLAPMLDELVAVLRYFGELVIGEDTAALLVSMSAATIDRRLAGERRKHQLRGRCTTKPGFRVRSGGLTGRQAGRRGSARKRRRLGRGRGDRASASGTATARTRANRPSRSHAAEQPSPVRDCRAVSGREAPTIGVEEEFFLVDPGTRALEPAGSRVVARAGTSLGSQVSCEFTQYQIEVKTRPSVNTAALREELVRLRTEAAAAAWGEGLGICASGTPVLANPEPTPISEHPRYRAGMRQYRAMLDDFAVCALHTHVHLSEREVAVLVANHVRPAPVRRCVVIDPAAVGTNHDPTKQVLPTSCP